MMSDAERKEFWGEMRYSIFVLASGVALGAIAVDAYRVNHPAPVAQAASNVEAAPTPIPVRALEVPYVDKRAANVAPAVHECWVEEPRRQVKIHLIGKNGSQEEWVLFDDREGTATTVQLRCFPASLTLEVSRVYRLVDAAGRAEMGVGK